MVATQDQLWNSLTFPWPFPDQSSIFPAAINESLRLLRLFKRIYLTCFYLLHLVFILLHLYIIILFGYIYLYPDSYTCRHWIACGADVPLIIYSFIHFCLHSLLPSFLIFFLFPPFPSFFISFFRCVFGGN